MCNHCRYALIPIITDNPGVVVWWPQFSREPQKMDPSLRWEQMQPESGIHCEQEYFGLIEPDIFTYISQVFSTILEIRSELFMFLPSEA